MEGRRLPSKCPAAAPKETALHLFPPAAAEAARLRGSAVNGPGKAGIVAPQRCEAKVFPSLLQRSESAGGGENKWSGAGGSALLEKVYM